MMLGRVARWWVVAAAWAVHFQDQTHVTEVLDRGTQTEDPSYVDLAVRIDASILDGPGQHLLGGLYMGSTIALETFCTQFVLDVEKAIGVASDRLYVLNVTEGDVHFSWRYTTTIVRFRMLAANASASEMPQPDVIAAVQDLTDQAQTPQSMLFQGNVTGALDEHWGVVALDWDMSLRLQYSIENVGDDLVEVLVAPNDTSSSSSAAPLLKTLDWGADRLCDEEPAPESAYCEWERYFEEDVAWAVAVARSRVAVLFVRPAAPDSVLCHFRILPHHFFPGEPSVSQATGNLVNQVSDSSSALYAGNVTVRVDPAWGVSGVGGHARVAASPHLPYAARANSSLPFHGYPAHARWADYERCKATHRCARAVAHYNWSTAAVAYTAQAFAGGAHFPADLFANFEDWRQGSFGWGPRGLKGWVSTSGNSSSHPSGAPFPSSGYDDGEYDVRAPRGAHVSPFAFEARGPRLRTVGVFQWCHERQACAGFWNDGLVLDAARKATDVALQEALVANVREDRDWIVDHAETALMDADGARTRRDVALLMRHRQRDVERKLEAETRILAALNASQCGGGGGGGGGGGDGGDGDGDSSSSNCSLVFNTSSAQMTGTYAAEGVVVTSKKGVELAVFAFEQIAVGSEVKVTVVGQRALVLTSRTSVFWNTSLRAHPGTLGGFPGGYSIGRRLDETLDDAPRDVPVGSLFPSNNANGPGAPSVRVHLRSITTRAADVREVQRVVVRGAAGETVGGHFRLQYYRGGGGAEEGDAVVFYETRALAFDVGADALAAALEEDLNRRPSQQRAVAEFAPGVGRVRVSKVSSSSSAAADDNEALPFDRHEWLVTFASHVGPLLGALSATSSLTGVGALVDVSRAVAGNEVGGSFALTFGGLTTRNVSATVSARDLAEVLVRDLWPLVVSAQAQRSDPERSTACDDGLCFDGPGPAGGLTWNVTLVTLADNPTALAPSAAKTVPNEPPDFLPTLNATSYLTGLDAFVTTALGFVATLPEDEPIRWNVTNHTSALSSFSLAFGGGGAGHGGIGGVGYGGYDGRGFVARAVVDASGTSLTRVDVDAHGGQMNNGAGGRLYGAADFGAFDGELLGGSGGALGHAHPFVPARFGSAGSRLVRGGAGGGAIEIVAMNDLEIGAGAVITVDAAEGEDGHLGGGGGGAGGSVVLAAGGVLRLHGQVSARGGDGGAAYETGATPLRRTLEAEGGDVFDEGYKGGGGGGGGRVALYARSLSAASWKKKKKKNDAAWEELARDHVDVSGGRCRALSEDGAYVLGRCAAAQDGGAGSVHAEATFESRFEVVIGDDIGGALGTPGALRLRSRSRASLTVDRESPVAFNGPEYELGDGTTEPRQPARLSFFVRIDPDDGDVLRPREAAGSWGAMLALFDAPRFSSAAASERADPRSTGFINNNSPPLPRQTNPQSENATVAFGLVLSDRIAHGSGFRASPGDLEAAGAGLLGAPGGAPNATAVHAALQRRWYKVDVEFDWARRVYDLFVDDVIRADDAPLRAEGVGRVGLYAISDSGEARFDEIYLGPDHLMGFRCPTTTREGVRFEVPRPAVRGWAVEDLGPRTQTRPMSRHNTHVSRRVDGGGLVAFDGDGHVAFRSDVKQRFASGDFQARRGAMNAGALLTLKQASSSSSSSSSWGPSRSMATRATTAASPGNAWSPSSPSGLGDDYSFEAAAGAAAAHSSEVLGETHFWYGEHDAPSGPLNVGDAAPSWLAGGVGACSSDDDLVTWRREGIALHYANLTNMVQRRSTGWQPGCGGSATQFGTRDGYGCAGSKGLRAIRPRVLVARPGAVRHHHAGHGFVMWMRVEDGNDTLALAGVASSAHAGGPFTFRRSFYADGNETRDVSAWNIGGGAPRSEHDPAAFALLGRTYFTTVEYVLPDPQMLPIWEMVRGRDGAADFGLSYHRAFYLADYDDYHDIYLQRWRLEDKPWEVLCVSRTNASDSYSVPRGAATGADGAVCPASTYYKVVVGQGHSDVSGKSVGVASRFKDPRDENNSFWRPDSVPSVRAQPWANNYVDGSCGFQSMDEDYDEDDPGVALRTRRNRANCSNVADNPLHGTPPDELVGVPSVKETRRAKFIAVSSLTPDLLDTTGVLDAFEGELEDMDLDGLLHSYGQFDWAVGGNSKLDRFSTHEAPVESQHFFSQKQDMVRFQQYSRAFNDRAFYSLACVIDGTCPVNFAEAAAAAAAAEAASS